MSFAEGSLEGLGRNRAKPCMKSLLHPVLGVGRRPRLETRLIDGILLMQLPFQASIPSINLISKPIYHEVDGILLTSSKIGQFAQFNSLEYYFSLLFI